MKVSLFITCMADMFAWNIGKATVELLEKHGCEVDFPDTQTCCGQPSYNSGYREKTLPAMQHMITVFEQSEYVVAPSGSCIAMLREYEHIFKDDPQWAKRARELAAKSYEITQFLYDVLGVRSVPSTFKGKVTYHPSCHMTRLLGVKGIPQELLRSIEGVELIDLPQAEDCCGFGGTFSVKNPVISGLMVNEKVQHIEETEAEYLVGGDLACLTNMEGRLTRLGKNVKAMHIVEILNQY